MKYNPTKDQKQPEATDGSSAQRENSALEAGLITQETKD